MPRTARNPQKKKCGTCLTRRTWRIRRKIRTFPRVFACFRDHAVLRFGGYAPHVFLITQFYDAAPTTIWVPAMLITI